MRLYRRLRDLIVNRILGVADTPQRIAFGVFLGFLVAMTPTIGFQIILYVAIATLLRANKVVGIPILFISNPFTAVPLYWFCWWVGAMILHGGNVAGMDQGELAAHIDGGEVTPPWTEQVFTTAFWREMVEKVISMGGELWLGCLVLGVLTGVLGYFFTLWAVRAYRRRD